MRQYLSMIVILSSLLIGVSCATAPAVEDRPAAARPVRPEVRAWSRYFVVNSEDVQLVMTPAGQSARSDGSNWELLPIDREQREMDLAAGQIQFSYDVSAHSLMFKKIVVTRADSGRARVSFQWELERCRVTSVGYLPVGELTNDSLVFFATTDLISTYEGADCDRLIQDFRTQHQDRQGPLIIYDDR